MTLSCDLRHCHVTWKCVIMWRVLWCTYDLNLVIFEVSLFELDQVDQNSEQFDLKWPCHMTFDLVMWPSWMCVITWRLPKIAIVQLWSKFGWNWSKPVRTGAIKKKVNQNFNGHTDARTYRIWIAMCPHEHSFRRHKNQTNLRKISVKVC